MLVSYGPEGKNHFQVNGNAVIQQGFDNFLDQCDGFGGEKRGDVVVGIILYISATGWTIPQVRRVLGALRNGVLEFMEGLF